MTLPASPYCRVRARVASIWADGPDDGTHPDWRPAVGERVTLTPSIDSQLLTYDVAGSDPIIVTVERVQCEVDADGWLAQADGRPVYIAPTDDPLMSATGWTWTASIKGRRIPFSAPSGGVVDLALFVATPAVDAVEYVSVVQVVADYIAANPPDVEQAVADYLTANPPAAAPDATDAAKGLVRLAGDLGGSADAPTVPGLADKADAGHTHTMADVTDYTAPDLSGYATTAALASGLSGKADDGHGHDIGDVSGLQGALDGKQPAGSYAPATHNHDDRYYTETETDALLAGKADTSHTHTAAQVSDATTTGRSVLTAANATAARTAIGAGTSNLAIGTTGTTAAAGNRTATEAAIGMVELATTAEATTGTDTTRAVTPAGVKAMADTKAPVSHTHAYADLTGKPTLGTAAATASTDYATAAQGVLADTAVQPGDVPSVQRATVTVPPGWTGSTTIAVAGMVGLHTVAPATAAASAAWATGGWWFSSTVDGQITVEGAAPAAPESVLVEWHE